MRREDKFGQHMVMDVPGKRRIGKPRWERIKDDLREKGLSDEKVQYQLGATGQQHRPP